LSCRFQAVAARRFRFVRPCRSRPHRVAGACLTLLLGTASWARAQPQLRVLDVPFIAQSESLCGGAAAAMVLRYWGERGLTAESFASLVDASAAGIRTNALGYFTLKRPIGVYRFQAYAQDTSPAGASAGLKLLGQSRVAKPATLD